MFYAQQKQKSRWFFPYILGLFILFSMFVGCDTSSENNPVIEYVTVDKPQDVTSPPTAESALNKTVGWSPNGFLSGQCTWFVDGTANENGWLIQFSQSYGRNGWTWYDLVTNATRSSNPQVGSIMVFNTWSGNPYGHVAWVTGVSGNNITVRHANWDGKGSVRTDTFVKNGSGVKVLGGSKTYPVRGYLIRSNPVRTGFGSVAALSVPSSITRGRSFSVSANIRETNGGNLSLPQVTIAVHYASGQYAFDCSTVNNFSLRANGNLNLSATCNVFTSLPKGTYAIYVKGKRADGTWFTFTPLSGVANPKSFTAN